MKELVVLDSFAVIAYLKKEAGWPKVVECLEKAQKRQSYLFLSLINWGEVYYTISRSLGKKVAEESLLIIDQLAIEVVDIHRPVVFQAAQFKAVYPIAYADCFAAALAKEKKCPLMTGDPEFKYLKDEIQIIWI